MIHHIQRCFVLASSGLLIAPCGAAKTQEASTQEAVTSVADVPLPGASARFDYQSLDTASNRLYIAHMRGNQLVVFVVASRKVLVADLPGATGVWAVPELHRVYVSVTGNHQIAVIDDRDYHIVARIGPISWLAGCARIRHQAPTLVCRSGERSTERVPSAR